ncbi:oligosaccharide flippase family protein [Arthrobacter woluwensis]|uniref:oligosaccharide flippase family protein n=1 Tax=Arthrobacter woluwensis TaxID=156980 RepID=UPI0015E67465|nr:oligosaccharide flippase family protein [Arthrobacter woluwensis]
MKKLDSRDIGRNALLSAIGNLALPLSTFLSAPLLARALGVDGRGELAAATAPLMLALTIAMFGIPEALTFATAKASAASLQGLRSGGVLLLLTGALAGIATFFAAPLLSAGNQAVGQIIQLTCVAIVPSVLLGAPRGLASGMHRWNLVNLEKLLTGISRFGGTLATFLTGTLTVETATLFIAVAPIVGGLAYIGSIRELVRGPRTVTKEARPANLAHYGFRMWLGSVSGILLSRVAQLIMLPLAGPVALGYFAVAVNISDASLLLNNAIRDVTMSADAADRSTPRLTATARISFLLSMLGGIALAASLPLWFVPAFGSEFTGAIPSVLVLISVGVFGVPGSIAGAGLAARGRPGLRSLSLFIALVFNVSVLVVLCPPLGALGAAIATLTGSLIASNLNIHFLNRQHGTRFIDFYAIRGDDLRAAVRLSRRVLNMRGR